jgi:ribulose-bisphosphate carboxylase small chain
VKKLETFSYLPELRADEIAAQVEHVLDRGLVVGVEYTSDPDPYDHYWTLWKLPLFGISDPQPVLDEVYECRRANPTSFIRVNGYDSVRQGQVLSFVVHKPAAAVT